jgi:hypothetical protein
VQGGRGTDDLSFAVTGMPDDPTPVPLLSPLQISLDGGPDNDVILVDYSNLLVEAPQVVSESGGPGNDTLICSVANPNPSTAGILNIASSFALNGGLDDDFIFVNISDRFGQQALNNVFVVGGPGTDIISLNYTGLLNGTLRFRLLGKDGNDQIEAVCTIDFVSTGSLDGLVFGGGDGDNLTFDVFFVLPDGSVTGNACGDLVSFSAVLNGGTGFDVCQKTPNVFAEFCEA